MSFIINVFLKKFKIISGKNRISNEIIDERRIK